MNGTIKKTYGKRIWIHRPRRRN